MTCEVAIANRLGVALAADSAVTFTTVDARGESKAYSSGANKIFQPLAHEPVGLMLYNNSVLAELPWELVVKTFRSREGHRSEPLLRGYVPRIVSFIEQADDLFPPEVRQAQTEGLYGWAMRDVLQTFRARVPAAVDTSQPAAARRLQWDAFAQSRSAELAAVPIDPCLNQSELEHALSQRVPALLPQMTAAIQQMAPDLLGVVNESSLLQLSVESLFKSPLLYMGGLMSGVVLAGFGAAEVLPSYVEHAMYGFVGSKLVHREISGQSVNRVGVHGSFMQAFARKSMVETFMQGMSPEAWGQAQERFVQHASTVAASVLAEAGASLAEHRINELVQMAAPKFVGDWASTSLAGHLVPLIQVVSSLTVDQVAELAETLVMLESLKERVTLRTQSVGGPIDVALITKTEGLVWIKRKHFFSAELNHRYFARLSREQGERNDQ